MTGSPRILEPYAEAPWLRERCAVQAASALHPILLHLACCARRLRPRVLRTLQRNAVDRSPVERCTLHPENDMSDFDLPLTSHMVAPVHVLSPTGRLASAAQEMSELGVSALPVVDSRRRLIGVLERTDLLRMGRLRPRPEPGGPRFWWPDVSVAECMQTTVPVAPPEHTLRQCARRMLERALHRVYVLADAELTGVLSTRELMRAVQRAGLATPLTALAEQHAETLAAQEPLAVACARLAASPGQALLLLADTAPASVFARAELRACLEVDPAQPAAPYGDESLIVLDADDAAWHAAERALAAKARYIVAREPERRYRILSGLSFASCICGGASGLQPAQSLSPLVDVSTSAPPRAARDTPVPGALPLPAHGTAPALRHPAHSRNAIAETPPASERRSEQGRAAEPAARTRPPAGEGS